MVHITKAGQKTVIITTHYIEEARQAHTVRMIKIKIKNVILFVKTFIDWLDEIRTPLGRGVTTSFTLNVPMFEPRRRFSEIIEKTGTTATGIRIEHKVRNRVKKITCKLITFLLLSVTIFHYQHWHLVIRRIIQCI